MTKKEEIITIRADAELKAALYAAAEQADRKYADQARWLLRVGLGLVKDEAPRVSVALPTDPALVRGVEQEAHEMGQRAQRLFQSADPKLRRHLLARQEITERAVATRQVRARTQNKKGVA